MRGTAALRVARGYRRRCLCARVGAWVGLCKYKGIEAPLLVKSTLTENRAEWRGEEEERGLGDGARE